MSNTRIWDLLGKTDPSQTKNFKRAGGFAGTAIKPMWAFKRMTEEFGPCGDGWGVYEPSFQIVPGDNREVLVYCTASIWWNDPKKQSGPHVVYGVGGDKVVTHIKENKQYNKPERWESDDEAFKKAYTDAITNALKLIGVGADVHMGMFDDNKYVNSLQNEFAEEKKKAAPEPEKPISNRMNKEKARDLYARMQKDLNDTANEGPDAITSLMKSDEMVNDLASLPEDWERALVEDAKSLYRAAKTFFEENEGPKQLDAAAYLKEHFPGSQEMKGN